jgi:SP family arabinose:H+ symporter-like MFS transporter
MLSGVLFVASAIGAALPTAAWQFLLARLVGGVAIGCASLVAPLYIAEISPAAIRGRLISIYQLAIVTGILAAYVSNYFVARLGQSSWRWMFGLGAIPATLLAQEEVIKRRELLVEGWLLEALGEVGPYLCAVEDPLARPHRIIGQTETGHVMRRNRNGKANTARRRFASGNFARRKHARRRG